MALNSSLPEIKHLDEKQIREDRFMLSYSSRGDRAPHGRASGAWGWPGSQEADGTHFMGTQGKNHQMRHSDFLTGTAVEQNVTVLWQCLTSAPVGQREVCPSNLSLDWVLLMLHASNPASLITVPPVLPLLLCFSGWPDPDGEPACLPIWGAAAQQSLHLHREFPFAP